ncbi:MAG: phospholipase D-like domain-containing protein [Campylobacterota bacterium]|nr:phospholipase D-like domain-containing protein [Campylobacterota bacterium]
MFRDSIKFTLMTLLFIAIFSSSLYGKDKIYFLPNETKIVKQDIISLLENANDKIDIAMYNFTYKKFNNALKKASKNGVKITIIYNKTKLKFNKKIELIKSKRKQHIKLAIIDDKYAIYGSANWKKESFGENYEIINITDDKKRVKEFIKIYKKLKEENHVK